MKIIVVEQDRCLACRDCERVCSFQDSGGFKHENTNIWVHIDMAERTIFTMTCQQCETPDCLEICPTAAIRRDPITRAVVVDETVCEGCKMCVDACPIGCIHFVRKRRVAAKCDLCQGDPMCVKNCMAKALLYCDINDLAAVKWKKTDKGWSEQPGIAKERIDDEG
jgi:carbon-monoxide dehydrogenase iron sulfur subunit